MVRCAWAEREIKKKSGDQLHEIQCRFQDLLSIGLELINNYGKVIATGKDETVTNDIIHDFILFCFTKGIKSSKAIDALITQGYIEDAKILARSVYECYLNGSYILATPENINLLVAAKVGVYSGFYKHPISKKGREIRSKIIDPDSDEVIDVALSLKEMSGSTFRESDSAVHDGLYSFLSEFAHVHMMASGAYRRNDQKWYRTDANKESVYATIFLCLYTIWLLLDMVFVYLWGKVSEIEKEIGFHSEVSNFLFQALQEIEFSEELAPMKENMEKRLNNT